MQFEVLIGMKFEDVRPHESRVMHSCLKRPILGLGVINPISLRVNFWINFVCSTAVPGSPNVGPSLKYLRLTFREGAADQMTPNVAFNSF